MWIDPRHFSRWLGPNDTSMEFIDAEIAEGKTTFYKMTYGDGTAMYGKMRYIKIKRPDYIEYSQSFCDERGNLSKHPNVPLWPDYMRTMILFARESNNDAEPQARVTVIWQPDGTASREEVEAFIDMRAGMTQGWTQAFDKLEELTGG